MTAVLPLTLNPDLVRALAGAVAPGPISEWPDPDDGSGFSAVRRGWRRLKTALRRLAQRARRRPAGVHASPEASEPVVHR